MTINNLAARCPKELGEKIDLWLAQNKMSTSQLVLRAVDNYISQNHELTSVPATSEEVRASLSKMKEQHKEALEKLK